ncbi:GntR family transcriptional regulator [Actinomadura gamaensis]|uniref:GntR family transcriptional regulator n=1 Tax=Actinomadura gamaensis TaxID=1763541 RepID=A0ABV9U3V2_9ACTN
MPARYAEIAADLHRRIRTGDLRPGQRLPTERELALHYDASRNTIRDAVLRLRGLRLLESRHGLGTFVLPPPVLFPTTLTPRDGSGGGDGPAWRAEASRHNRVARADTVVVEVLQADGETAAALDVPEGEPLLARHQRRYLSRGPGTSASGDMDGDSDVPWLIQTTYYPLAFAERGAFRLLRAEEIEEGSVAYVQDALGIRQARYCDTIHVRPPEKDEIDFFGLPAEGTVPVFVQRRTSWSQEGRPFRYTVTVYPTDRNQLVIEAELGSDGA